MNLLDAAHAWSQAGCAVVPVAPDGSKRPAVAWKAYQQTRPTDTQLDTWFAGDTFDGLGIICGAVSGHLEMLELEGRAVTDGTLVAYADALTAHGLDGVWNRLGGGYVEASPSGGLHYYYRLADAPARRNLKLASRPADGGGLDVLIETRGEGGYVVAAPSAGRTHPTGNAWTALSGSPATIAVLTAEERDALHAVATLLDTAPATEHTDPPSSSSDSNGSSSDSTGTDSGLRPGDDYNNRATWEDILTGWTKVRPLGTGHAWRRPGKHTGISATTGQAAGTDRLYVFSTSTPFTACKPYTKFAAHTLLRHGGDYSAAAKALHKAGYGHTGATHDLRGLIAPPAAPTAPATSSSPAAAPQTRTAVHEPPAAGLTDVGNAQLLVATHGKTLRYIPERGTWLTWGGTHWQTDDAGRVFEYAKDVILRLQTDRDGDVAKHRTRSLSRRAIEAMVSLARTAPPVVTPAALLDSDPYALCTPGGVVDLLTGAIKDADPADLHTRCTAVPADQDAPTPRWDSFLDDTFGDDDELRTFVQRLAGYSATGIVTHHVLPFLHGSGGNGKSVFLDVLRRVLGDYAATAPAGFLLGGIQQHETEIARLAGLRLVICSEVNQEARFDEAKVKLLTGGDALTARFMHRDHFTFVPTHHLWLMGNHQPRISAGGESFARRLRLIPFTRQVPPEKKIDGLDAILADTEGPGILAWVVAGAVDALAHGLPAPEDVLVATRTYMTEEDTLARFVEDRCHLGGGEIARVNTADLRRAYETWCKDEGERALSPQVLGRELRTRFGIQQAKSNGRRYYTNMTLLSDDEESTDSEPDEWWQK